MINSPQLKSNPNLLVFLPMFYWVWQDAVLTPSEIKLLEQAIQSQDWLAAHDREYLLSLLNPTTPPAPDELKEWLEEIRTVEFDPQNGLIDTGIKLAHLRSKNGHADVLIKSRPPLDARSDERRGGKECCR